jgi:DNA repair protein SbcC/Rad50
MIPLRLTLKNFLSYQAASLDFQGLHTACICGANGAGKSSLLEAIAWAIWGESRVSSEDDVIHLGATEAQVDFIFTAQQHTYRILRTRQRTIGTSLEFQIATSEVASLGLDEPGSSNLAQAAARLGWSFRSLTAKGIRATQHQIIHHLKLDYDTFINSAYLRQGKADEFMLKRPSERKQILADLLKLNQYDELAEKAKDQMRQFKGQQDFLQGHMEAIQQHLQQHSKIAQEQAMLEATLADLQTQQAEQQAQLQQLHAVQHQRNTWQQQLTWQQQQQQILAQDCERIQQELAIAQQQQQELHEHLQQGESIIAGYAQLQMLQTQEEQLSLRFKTYQALQTEKQDYRQQQSEKTIELNRQIQQVQLQLETVQQQQQDLEQILKKAPTIDQALHELQQARAQLQRLDQQHTQATPLLHRQQQVQSLLDREQTRLSTRLDELRHTLTQLQAQQSHQPELEQAIAQVSDQIIALEQRRDYQQQVRDKGFERRTFMEHLQQRQRDYETQLANVEQKIHLLQQDAEPELCRAQDHFPSTVERSPEPASPSPTLTLKSPLPPCPLCDRDLDEHHRQLVLAKHQTERQTILDQLWVLRDQLSAAEREIQILRQEYRQLDKELNPYSTLLEQRGQLQAQLQAVAAQTPSCQGLLAETEHLAQQLETKTYADDLQHEWQQLEASLHTLNYDECNHALARGDVDRLRWAEIKSTELKQAQKRQAQLQQQQPELAAQLASLQAQHTEHETTVRTHLAKLDWQLSHLGYDVEQHNALRATLRQAQAWQLRYQALCQARQQFPQVQQRIDELSRTLRDRQQAQASLHSQRQSLVQHLHQTPDSQAQIDGIEQQLQQQRTRLDQQFAALGRVQQQQQQLERFQQQLQTYQQQHATIYQQQRVYHELAQAFGKNGIQAFMIENALPHLEAEANRILSRLSANQLHVQFVTQRASGHKSKAKATKLIETLDILIADAHGTRPYETYSGGEAFRVNFAIRLAMAKLLAQRSGTALQLLVVDEGFGTQDAEGCDRLVGAINAIAPDFACILTVTHVPHFKEAFQARIEVHKTEHGSQLHIIA